MEKDFVYSEVCRKKKRDKAVSISWKVYVSHNWSGKRSRLWEYFWRGREIKRTNDFIILDSFKDCLKKNMEQKIRVKAISAKTKSSIPDLNDIRSSVVGCLIFWGFSFWIYDWELWMCQLTQLILSLNLIYK